MTMTVCRTLRTGLRRAGSGRVPKQLRSEPDDGASVCITIDGTPVVDLWGGTWDEDHSLPWEEDTVVNVYSTTKTMAALTMLLLADRGVFALEDSVAKSWPEFAAEGKEKVTHRHASCP